MAPKNPETIGRYQVIERVGKGGMGVLYRGIDPVLDREVAIKVMLVDFSEDEEQMRPRFYREARASAKLQHRNIVTVFEFAEEGSTPYIVMEFLRGDSLAARMASPIPLSVDEKLGIIAQLCAALHYAHEQGVVHRDVKPANIFLLTDGTVKLLDFGIAKVMTSNLTRTGDVLGSASYMSPEQVSGSATLDGRSDIFSAGVVLYELLAGRKPFHAEAPTAIVMKILHDPPAPLEQFAPGLPAPLIAAVNKALAKDPADRFATAGDFAKELEWIRRALPAAGDSAAGLEETRFATAAEIRSFQNDAASRPATAVMPAPATVPPASGRRWLIPAIVGGVIVAAVAVGVGLRLRNAAEPPPSEAAALPTQTSQTALPAGAPAGATAPTPGADPAAGQPAPAAGDTTPAGDLPAASPATAPPVPQVPQPAQDARAAASTTAAPAVPSAPTTALPAPAPGRAGEPPVGAAKPAEAGTAAKAATAGDTAEAAAAAAAPTGSLFIDFVNTFPDGSIEVEVDGRRRFSEKLGLSQQVGGLSKLKLQRVSEQLGSEVKVPAGDHKIAVTLLNADGEVRDFANTSLHIFAARAATLKIRLTRLKNKLQLETAAGEPEGK